MISSKLFHLLKALSPKETTHLRHFLQNPMFNKRTDVVLALDFLTDQNNRPFGKEALFQYVYTSKKYAEKDLHLLSSRLFKLAEDFLALRNMMGEPILKKIHLAKAYRKLKQEKNFQVAVRDANQLLDKQPLRNAATLRQQIDLEDEYYDYIASPKRQVRTNLQTWSDTFDAYVLASKLKQACLHLSRNTINQEVYQIGLLEEVLHYIKEHPGTLKLPAVAVHYYCYMAITNLENEAYFTQLRQAIREYYHCFYPGEIRDIYLLAINFCIRRLNTGQQERYAKEAFELYRSSLEQGFLLEDGIIPESTFSNIVSLALWMGEYRWTENFIESFRQNLKTEIRATIVHFNLAKLRYQQKRPSESLRHLATIQTKAPFLMLGAKTMQLKIYYELDETNALDSLMENMRIYLQRRKDLGYRKQNYENLLYLCRKLIDLPAYDKALAIKLKEEIEGAEILTEKEWLLKQLDAKAPS
ncbi:MAG: hypothetical protein AAFZ15_14750 [Bacteroidota bacterium]